MLSKTEFGLSRNKEQNAFREALEKGTLSCLPDKEGYADTRNVYDPFSQNKDNRILGVNGILVRDFLKENGFKVSAVITWDEAKKMEEALHQGEFAPAIKKDSHGVHVTFHHKTDEMEPGKDGKMYPKYRHDPQILYSAEQTPSGVDAMFKYLKEQHGFERPNRKNTNRELTVESGDPVEYLKQHSVACFFGDKLKVPPAIAAEFKEKMTAELSAVDPKLGRPNPFILQNIANKAAAAAKQVIDQTFSIMKEQKRERGQTQSAASLAEEAIKPSVPRKP
ncbi:MAG: hypothetical protein MdMp014T_2816 [Treponematales bacterium]